MTDPNNRDRASQEQPITLSYARRGGPRSMRRANYLAAAAFLGPFTIQSIYLLVFSRWHNRVFDQWAYLIVLLASLTAGAVCLSYLPMRLRRAARIALVVLYVLAMVPLLLLFPVLFVSCGLGP